MSMKEVRVKDEPICDTQSILSKNILANKVKEVILRFIEELTLEKDHINVIFAIRALLIRFLLQFIDELIRAKNLLSSLQTHRRIHNRE